MLVADSQDKVKVIHDKSQGVQLIVEVAEVPSQPLVSHLNCFQIEEAKVGDQAKHIAEDYAT